MIGFLRTSLLALVCATTCLPLINAEPLKVRLNPAGTRADNLPEPDYTLWTVAGEASASTTISGVTLTLSVPSGSVLKGSSWKLFYTRGVSFFGERIISEGVTTDTTTGQAITLTVKGLSVGTHTLLTYHNAWDALTTTATVSVSVDGTNQVSGVAQTIRQDSFWNSGNSYVTFSVTSTTQTVTIVYTPATGVTDRRVFLNGLEFDTSDVDNQVSYPVPSHHDEHFDIGSATSLIASWKAPKSLSSPKYNVYFGTSPTSLTTISTGQTGLTATFTGLNTMASYYWRVDTLSSSNVTYTGRVFDFRLAQLAFPGAEGYGRFARGGRGGKVVRVTKLTDDGSAGTLRYALVTETGPRYIIFDVAGVITLTSRLSVSGTYIYLAGQTAPGKGIAIQGWPVGLSGGSDVIFRHIRVRPGNISGQTIDGMGLAGANHAIFDRVSMGWAIDECFSSRNAFNITLQRSMISEPLNVAGHQNYPAGTAHGYAASIGGNIGSFHHNLIAHAEGRSWSMAGGLDGANVFAGRLDIRNNVVYNFGSRVTDGGAHQVNFVSNFYKPGPASSSGPKYDLQGTYEDNFGGSQTYYCSGNSMPGVFDQSSTQFKNDGATGPPIACYASISISPAPTYQKFFSSQFFDPKVTTQTSTEAYKRVLSDSGVSQPLIDDHDKRIITETYKGTTTYTGSVSGKKGLIDKVADAGGLESFPTTTRAASWDANGDGIADWWDGSTGGTGYEPIEGYLNFMADPHLFVSPSKTQTLAVAQLAAGFVSPTFTVSGPMKGSVTVSGSTVTYTAGATAGIDSFTLSIKDSEGSTWDRKIGVAIYAGAN